VLVIGFWQLAGSGRLGQSAVPAGAVSDRGCDLQGSRSTARCGSTFPGPVMRIGSGWILGTVAGVIVGFAIGLSTLARGVGITFISALFSDSENRAGCRF